jgi:hypothetical protein
MTYHRNICPCGKPIYWKISKFNILKYPVDAVTHKTHSCPIDSTNKHSPVVVKLTKPQYRYCKKDRLAKTTKRAPTYV